MSVEKRDTVFYVATWNVGSKSLDGLDLHNLLGLKSNPENDSSRPDFYVIGLQDVARGHVNEWRQKFIDLMKIREYVIASSEKLNGILLFLFAKRQHLLQIRDIEVENERTGFGGVWGNKGGICIRFSWNGTSVCIVNVRLAAHDHEEEERIEDFEEIVRESNFHVESTPDIFSHDYVIFFGDLNFRLTGMSSAEHIRNLIDTDKLDELIAKDELTLIRQKKRAFTELIERLPNFPPTYKFKKGTSEYDLKLRPAWTDRILYKQPKNVEYAAVLTAYRSHPGYTHSDHKPVTAEIIFKVPEKCKKAMIRFWPVQDWRLGEVNVIRYSVPIKGFEENDHNWIGVFKEDFTCLDDFVINECITHRKPVVSEIAGDDHRYYNMQFKSSKFVENERYVLLYFESSAKHGLRRVTSVLGMSDSFKAVR